MDPYIWPVTCSVCGGEGMGHAWDIGAEWLGGFVHKNPEVCRANIIRERRELQQERDAIAEANRPVMIS